MGHTGMSPEAKARLKAVADAKKGTTTLMGLDQTRGLVGLDNVQDREGSLPQVKLTVKGNLFYDMHQVPMPTTIGANQLSAYLRTMRHAKEAINGNTCPWVKLGYAAAWQKAELGKRFGQRMIAFQTRVRSTGGTGFQTDWVTEPVFPLAQVIAWFRFLWPKPQEWGERAKKYLTGITDLYTRMRPGVGQPVLVSGFKTVVTDVNGLGLSVVRKPHNYRDQLGLVDKIVLSDRVTWETIV